MQGVTGLKSVRLWLLSVFALAMVGCASVEPPELRHLPERVELNGVPFFRGNANQSGPQVLASMLGQQRIRITPGLLVKPLKLPGAEASLQDNINLCLNLFRGIRFRPIPVFCRESSSTRR